MRLLDLLLELVKEAQHIFPEDVVRQVSVLIKVGGHMRGQSHRLPAGPVELETAEQASAT